MDIEDVQEYIQSQYSNSPTMKQILLSLADNINPDADIDIFYQNIMNIDSANGVGLDIWGTIVGAPRKLQLEEDSKEIILNDDMYRNYIKFKMLANISPATLETLNKISYILYNNTSLSVANVQTEGTLDNGDFYNTTPMMVRFTWQTSQVTDQDRAIFMQGILFCLAAGVGWDLVVINTDNIFGFAGSGLSPFNQGTFAQINTKEG